MSLLLEGEGKTPDNILRLSVTPRGVVFDIYDENKGKTRIFISRKGWSELKKYVDRKLGHSTNVLLEGEGSAPDNFLRLSVTPKVVIIDIYDENKGKIRFTISRKEWTELAKYINGKLKQFQDPEGS